jgi:hypothetical protein
MTPWKSSSWNSANIMDTATYASLAAIPRTKVPACVASSHRIQKTERSGVTRKYGAHSGSGKSALGDISETGKFQPIKDDFCDQHLPLLCHPRRDTNGFFREYRRTRTPVRSRARTAIPTIESGLTKRDLTVSSFMLALVLVGVIVAAHTDRPVFWLLIGPTPFVVLHITRNVFATVSNPAGRAARVRRTGSMI